MPRTYLDFDLLIERAGAGYRARVLDSPSGQAAMEFALPFSSLEMENFLLRITRSLGDVRRRVRRIESPERELVKDFGSKLFQAVFSGAVQGALQSSLNEAYRRNAGLRLRLRLTDTPELTDVPWEFLHNPVSNQFLSLSPDTPVVRYLDLPLAARPLTVTPPIRVLVMISSPTDFPQLDVAAEWDRLNSSLHDLIERGLVSLTRLANATLASLQRPLRLSQYHVFHFVGHGGFDEQSQEGALALEDARGRGRLVSGQDLGVMLTGHRSLRLVILNACEGARSSSSDPFAGVAQSLIQQAIPAVVAMQFEITDDAAITFAHEFYGAVADGYPVDAALAESRRAIFAQGSEFEWATPVLYMRSRNGQLFRIAPPDAEEVAAQQRAEEEAERQAAQRAEEEAEREAAEQRARQEADREAAQKRAREAQREAAQRAKDEAEKEAAERPVIPSDIFSRPSSPSPAGSRLQAVIGGRPGWVVVLPLVASLLMIAGILLPFAESYGEAKWLWGVSPATVLEPLGAAIVVAFSGLRSRHRDSQSPFLNGLLIGCGIFTLGLFVAYSTPRNALCGEVCSATPNIGVFGGLAGGAIAVVAGLVREWKHTAASSPESWNRRRAAMSVLAVGGGIGLILATTSSLIGDGSKTILRDFAPFSLPPLAAAVVGLASPIGLAAAASHRGVVPGVLIGAGVETLLFFLGISAVLDLAGSQAGPGIVFGFLGGALFVAGGALGPRRSNANAPESGLGVTPPS